MAPVRMLAIAAVDHPGGAEIGLLRLIDHLPERWHVTLTTPGAGALRESARQRGLAHDTLPLGGIRNRQGARAFASLPKARALGSQHDVAYFNGGVAARLLPALARPKQLRRVLHVHDLVDRVPPHWRLADVVLADSRAVAERLGELDNVHVVGCPIDAAPAPVSAPWGDDGRPVVGFVGRLEPRKNPSLLLDAAPGLDGVRIVLVGDAPYGDQDYAERVRAQARQVGAEVTGWVADAAGLMSALDVLVLPSTAEPFGTVLAEAMNAGTPVVATRVGGLADVVADGSTGRLVAPDDPLELAAAIREALDHRSDWGDAGRERARRWHADAYAARVTELIAP